MTLLARIFSFQGRLSRIGWWRAGLNWSLATTAAFVASIVMTMNGLPGWAPWLLAIPYLISAVSLAVRRLHDRNRSGWWLLMFQAAPLALAAVAKVAIDQRLDLLAVGLVLVEVGLVVWAWIELGFLKGTIGPNRFGSA